jgi:hypothetical protein
LVRAPLEFSLRFRDGFPTNSHRNMKGRRSIPDPA